MRQQKKEVPKEPFVETLQARAEEEKPKYTPRPRWQLVMAWVLIGIMVVAILNLWYWQVFQH